MFFVLLKVMKKTYNKIMEEVSILLENKEAYEKMSRAVNPYGDGKACGRIVNVLL